MYMHAYMYMRACVHVERHSLLGTIPFCENYGMTFDLWNIISREHCVCSGAQCKVLDREVTYMYMYIRACICACVALFVGSLRRPYVCMCSIALLLGAARNY